MSALVTLLLAGTVVSTTIKVGILVVGAKAYRARKQEASTQTEQPAQTEHPTLGQRFAQWIPRKRRSSAPPEV